MSTISPPLTVVSPPPGYPLRRFRVDEYHQMIQAGILTEDDPVELLEGWIVVKMPRNPPHDSTIELVDEALRKHLPAGWRVRIQSAITTSDSEPEPDLVVVRGSPRQFVDHHPGPSEIGLVIEVAESTLDSDRLDKGRVYARAAIPCYWIVNLVDRQIEVYTDPTGPDANPAYRQRQDFAVPGSVSLVIEGKQVATVPASQLLP